MSLFLSFLSSLCFTFFLCLPSVFSTAYFLESFLPPLWTSLIAYASFFPCWCPHHPILCPPSIVPLFLCPILLSFLVPFFFLLLSFCPSFHLLPFTGLASFSFLFPPPCHTFLLSSLLPPPFPSWCPHHHILSFFLPFFVFFFPLLFFFLLLHCCLESLLAYLTFFPLFLTFFVIPSCYPPFLLYFLYSFHSFLVFFFHVPALCRNIFNNL